MFPPYAMLTQLQIPRSNIEQIIESIFSSRKITRADQHFFMSTALSQNWISQNEQIQINRVFEALHRGLLRVVD